MEGYVSRRFGGMVDEHCARAKEYAIRTMLLFSLSESIDLLVMALAFWYGGSLLVHEHYDTEQFFVVFVAIVFGAQSAGSYFAHSSEIAKGVAAARDIDDACASVGRLEQSSGALEQVADEVGDHVPLFECRHVNFAYPERPECPALVDFNIKMHPGQFIAFIGESGSGKSTITQLLERFYDVDSGAVYISGRPVSSISTDSLRSNFSMVSQEPILYQGTIRDNLLLGVDAVPSQDVIDACLDACQLKDLIASLPEGDLTQVGTCGSTLSGGQKQRLAIARAILRDSPVLLLDEATSALDSETEHLIQRRLVDDFLASKRRRRGIVAIAHRLSTIRHADVIYVMREGRIIESGSHDELCALGGLYYSMWTAGDQSA
ncbi:hypothetical protein NQ176_g9883 [Zarea fungicola]|uniref:Uncharacterized protein n=1 Tax=Zarea fungicola TaxID=93591 RepID=A0ACC1ML82_9HYPO|nr:hypothetical protein NQ176_g9883 [Lecanicillium fungicola]